MRRQKVATTVAALAVLLSGCGSDPIRFSGVVTLNSDGVVPVGEEGCRGTGGYDDMREGAPVVVYDATGKIVGTGQIDFSLVFEDSPNACFLSWTVPDVEGDAGPYQYEIANRGRLTVTEAEAREGGLQSSLGDG